MKTLGCTTVMEMRTSKPKMKTKRKPEKPGNIIYAA
jgi:hypothetical protein